MAKAMWNGVLIAEASTDQTRTVEGNIYFPLASVRQEFLRPSPAHTHCPWKGEASYYDLEVEGRSNPQAAWYYADPKAAAAEIRGLVAFWKGVEVSS